MSSGMAYLPCCIHAGSEMQRRIILRDCVRGEGWRTEEEVSCPQSGVVSEQLEGCVLVGGCVTHQDDT